MPELTIAVLHYNRWDLTQPCLESVNSQNIPVSYNKILVDNGSASPVPTVSGWKTVRLDKNVGNVNGQNACFQAAETDWMLFVSNDVRLEPGCIQSLWQARGWDQLMPVILNRNRTVQSLGGKLWWPGYGTNLKRLEKLDYVPSICYLMPKALWEMVGGFDPEYPMAYEDVDMGLRLGKDRMKVAGSAAAIHLGNQTLQYRDGKPFKAGRKMLVRKRFSGIDRMVRLVALSLAV